MRKLVTLFENLPDLVDVVVVEGHRDVMALRTLRYSGVIEELNKNRVNDFDLSDELASKYTRILLLLDFDEEGMNLHHNFTLLLERKGVKVEYGLRREVGILMAAIGVYAIESLDNIRENLDQ
jgi:5S rRNA maturation endonuclease (ribonuclease M5)